jgi:site-specific DNA recombinase
MDNGRKKIVGYCRVSTDNQKEEGTIEIQQKALAEYAQAKGYKLIEVFSDEGVSGGLENRPALSAMFDFLEAHPEIEGVLIYKLDRLARDLYIQEHLIKKLDNLSMKLISIKEPNLESTDPMRKAFRQFMGIVSELEKSFITMRLSGGRINKARKGGYAGGSTALGYRAKDKELTIDEDQAQTVQAIFKMKRHKRMGLREIARELNAQGIPTARGGKWYASTVKYVLDNPIYKGKLNYNGEKAKRAELALL